MLVDHVCILKQLKPDNISSQKISCQTHKFWLLVVSSNYFTKFHDFSRIIQVFSNSMIFPYMKLFFDVFQVFHDFQSLRESCYKQHRCRQKKSQYDQEMPESQITDQSMAHQNTGRSQVKVIDFGMFEKL